MILKNALNGLAKKLNQELHNSTRSVNPVFLQFTVECSQADTQ